MMHARCAIPAGKGFLAFMRRLPRPVLGPDLRALPISPAEAFVFSRVDGASDGPQLALATGLSEAEVKAALERLYQLGVIEFSGGPPSSASVDTLKLGRTEQAPAYDPAELHEDVELEPDRRRAVLELYYRIERISHYELLGLPRSADRKAIKRAYYELAPLYHPDSYFRRRLGSFKSKIEAIFTRLTLAHDVLTHRDRRAEYDLGLQESETKSPVDALHAAPIKVPAASPAPSEPLHKAERALPAVQERPAPDPEKIAEIERIRRQTLARKLATGPRFPGGSAPKIQAPSVVGAPPLGAGKEPERAAFAEAASKISTSAPNTAGAEKSELEQWIEAAALSEQRGDVLASAEALRNAVALAPERGDLRQRWQKAHEQAQGVLARSYLKQAASEVSQGNWLEAAWSFAKAASMLPNNAEAHERVAFATLACRGSAQRAVEYAQRAVELSPKRGAYRITLARAHLADGAFGLAQSEIDEALAVSAGDTAVESMARDLMQQIQKQRTASEPAKADGKPVLGSSKGRRS